MTNSRSYASRAHQRPPGAPFFVSDVDGTLTTSENEEAWDFLLNNLPDANALAAQALQVLSGKGYRPMYITARPRGPPRSTFRRRGPQRRASVVGVDAVIAVQDDVLDQ